MDTRDGLLTRPGGRKKKGFDAFRRKLGGAAPLHCPFARLVDVAGPPPDAWIERSEYSEPVVSPRPLLYTMGRIGCTRKRHGGGGWCPLLPLIRGWLADWWDPPVRPASLYPRADLASARRPPREIRRRGGPLKLVPPLPDTLGTECRGAECRAARVE